MALSKKQLRSGLEKVIHLYLVKVKLPRPSKKTVKLLEPFIKDFSVHLKKDLKKKTAKIKGNKKKTSVKPKEIAKK